MTESIMIASTRKINRATRKPSMNHGILLLLPAELNKTR